MQVSAVGGMGAGAAGGAAGAVGSAAAGGASASAPTGSLTGTFLQGTTPAGPEAITDLARSFDTNLLFTLLILALLDKGDEKGGGVAGALGFLAGLSLAAQLGQSLGNQAGQSVAEVNGGGIGGQFDVAV